MRPGPTLFLETHLRLGHPVLVGEAPGQHGDPDKPLTGFVGRRLAELAGLWFPGQYARNFGRVNLLDEWPGAAVGGGSQFPHEAGVAAADELLAFCATKCPAGTVKLVLLGRRVARAFGVAAEAQWFGWHVLALPGADGSASPSSTWTALGYVFPHPSQTSLYWNERANVEAARSFLAGLVPPSARRAPG